MGKFDVTVLPEGGDSDPDVLAKNPFFKIMLEVFKNAVARPSTVTGADYNQLSTTFFQNANEVLTGAESGKDAVVRIVPLASPSFANLRCRQIDSLRYKSLILS